MLQASLQTENGKSHICLSQFRIPEDIEIPDKFNPMKWNISEIQLILNTAENSIRASVNDLRLRAKVLRKERAVGVFPGGDEMTAIFPKGS